MFSDEDLLPLSGLQHPAFCERQLRFNPRSVRYGLGLVNQAPGFSPASQKAREAAAARS
jgi:hypothetical protein